MFSICLLVSGSWSLVTGPFVATGFDKMCSRLLKCRKIYLYNDQLCGMPERNSSVNSGMVFAIVAHEKLNFQCG